MDINPESTEILRHWVWDVVFLPVIAALGYLFRTQNKDRDKTNSKFEEMTNAVSFVRDELKTDVAEIKSEIHEGFRKVRESHINRGEYYHDQNQKEKLDQARHTQLTQAIEGLCKAVDRLQDKLEGKADK